MKKILFLIIDMQNEFVRRDMGEALQFKEMGEWERWIPFHDRLDNVTIPACKKMLDYFRANNMYVTYGRIACLLDNGEDRCAVQKSEGWNGMLLPVNSVNAAMIDELAPQDNEIVVNKTTDSVVTGTNYVRLMQNMGIETIVVCGIVTSSFSNLPCKVPTYVSRSFLLYCNTPTPLSLLQARTQRPHSTQRFMSWMSSGLPSSILIPLIRVRIRALFAPMYWINV